MSHGYTNKNKIWRRWVSTRRVPSITHRRSRRLPLLNWTTQRTTGNARRNGQSTTGEADHWPRQHAHKIEKTNERDGSKTERWTRIAQQCSIVVAPLVLGIIFKNKPIRSNQKRRFIRELYRKRAYLRHGSSVLIF